MIRDVQVAGTVGVAYDLFCHCGSTNTQDRDTRPAKGVITLTDTGLLYLTAFVLGVVHAFDTDHVVAVSGFVAKNPNPCRAAFFGFHWGLGHSSILLVLGLVALALKIAIPEAVEWYAEVLVGFLLTGIGLWVLRDLRRSAVHTHSHHHGDSSHEHPHHHGDPSHFHRHSITMVGMAHGLAGTAATMVLIPVALMSSLPLAGFYLLVFGLGTILSMTFYGYLAGRLYNALTSYEQVFQWVKGGTGLASLVIGVVWLARSLTG